MRVRTSVFAVSFVLSILALAPAAFAGTQDFVLVNSTGEDIYELYLSESANEHWEEDVLGAGVLYSGDRINITFSGRSACLWDLMVADDEGTTVTWQGLNLCESSVVILRCDEEECWAEYE